ncbi:MAG: IS110 family transposase [Phycisphaerales bacterium]
MLIVSLDLGQSKSVACVFGEDPRYMTIPTTSQAIHDLIVEHAPDRLVIEIGPSAAWVHDLAVSLGVEVQVANPNHEGWRWRNTRHKSDRRDALKLAQLSVMGQLPTVHMPSPERRAHRALIRYRQSLVTRCTAIKNSIRAVLTRRGMRWPAGKSGWSKRRRAELHDLSVGVGTWRLQLREDLAQLEQVEASIARVELELEQRADEGVMLLRTIPGVGPRLAEAVVAVLDDPHRFKNGRHVASYVGLAPRRIQSGSMDRQGRISGRGDKMLRSLLVEVAWLGRRHNPWMKAVYERALRGSPARKKIAIVALARRLLVRCWAMLRDRTPWRPPVALKLAA